MNDVDIRRHEGTVVESGHDLTLSVLIETLGDEPFKDVRPESIGPVRWRPAENDRVVIYERVGPLRPDIALTWVGLAPDVENEALVPEYLEAGRSHLIGEDGIMVISVEDDADPVTLPDGNDSDTSIVRIGSEAATEPLVLGGVWRTKMRSIIDEMTDVAQNLSAAALALQSAATALAAAVWPVAGGGGGAASPPAPDAATFTAAANNGGNASTNALTAKANLLTLKTELDEAYSHCAFTVRDAPRQT